MNAKNYTAKLLLLLALIITLSACTTTGFNPAKVEDYKICGDNEYKNCYY